MSHRQYRSDRNEPSCSTHEWKTQNKGLKCETWDVTMVLMVLRPSLNVRGVRDDSIGDETTRQKLLISRWEIKGFTCVFLWTLAPRVCVGCWLEQQVGSGRMLSLTLLRSDFELRHTHAEERHLAFQNKSPSHLREWCISRLLYSMLPKAEMFVR